MATYIERSVHGYLKQSKFTKKNRLKHENVYFNDYLMKNTSVK